MTVDLDQFIAAATAHGLRPRQSGQSYNLKCPHPDHDDTTPSASVRAATNGHGDTILLTCHGECATPTMDPVQRTEWLHACLKNLDLWQDDLSSPPIKINTFTHRKRPASPGERTFDAIYDDGTRAGAHGRRDGQPGTKKKMWWDPTGVTVARLALYGSDAIESLPDPVVVVEGERAQIAMTKRGHTAVATYGTTHVPSDRSLSVLAGRDVVLFPDAGDRHMLELVPRLTGVAASVNVVRLDSTYQPGWDAADADGDTIADLLANDVGPADPITPQPPRWKRLSEVGAARKRWLWRDWLPIGDVTIGEGMGALGKSMAVVDFLARYTTGREMPDGSPHPTGKPETAIYITAEDDFSTVVLPRLVAAGGDPDRIIVIEKDFTLPGDLDLLREIVAETGATFVLIDPIFSHIESAKVNPNHDSEMREHVMKPLAGVAKEMDGSVFGMRHFNKTTGVAVTMRGSGSYGGMSGAARSVITAVEEPPGDDDDDARTGRTIIGVTKSNNAVYPKALVYSIHPRFPGLDPVLAASIDRFAPEPIHWDMLDSIGVVVWEGEAPMSVETAQRRLDSRAKAGQRDRDSRADADLRVILTGKGKVPAKTVYDEMRRAGNWGETVTQAARVRIGAKYAKDGNSGPWVWWLDLEEGGVGPSASSSRSSPSSARTTPDETVWGTRPPTEGAGGAEKVDVHAEEGEEGEERSDVESDVLPRDDLDAIWAKAGG